MAQILTYAAGVGRQGTDESSGRERQAKAIMNLAQKFSRDMQANALGAIEQSQQDAALDAIQGTIDPNRRKNDEAYAATVLVTELNKTNAALHADLDNPQSAAANMDPDEYRKGLEDQAKQFYDGLEGSDYADTQAKVFTDYARNVKPGLIAKQSKVYKDNRKRKQGEAATVALSQLPPGDGEAYYANTEQIIQQMLPEDRFTSQERLNILMGAARGSVQTGDRRLLEHLEVFYDAEAFAPVKVQQAENAYTTWQRQAEDNKYAELYKAKQQQAEAGEYTERQWESDIVDPEMTRRFGRSKIDAWKKAGRTAHIQQLNYNEGMAAFYAGKPMVMVDDKTQQQIFRHAKRDLLEKAAQAGTDEAKLNAITDYAFFMSKQGTYDKELKDELQARLNRPVFTKEAWADPRFQEAAIVASALSKVLTPQQMAQQLGDEAWSNAMLVQQFMNDSPGDPEKAADAYLIAMNRRKDMPELATAKPHRTETAAAVTDILSGDLPGHDPAMTGWLGIGSKADNAVHTGRLQYEFEKQYGIEIDRGIAHAEALKLAKNKVAAKTRYFGNELIWTGGADLNEVLSMPYGSSASDLQNAWEVFADTLGIDADKAHASMVGQYLWITDDTGAPIEEAGLIPLTAIGNTYEQKLRDEREDREARNLEDKVNDISSNNRLLETSLNQKTGFNDKAQILEDGTTLGDFKDADEEARLLIRKQYDEEHKSWLAKMLKPIVDFKHNIDAGKYEGEAAERFKTVAIDPAPTTDSVQAVRLTDRAVAGIREVDSRSQKAAAESKALLSSRDKVPNELKAAHTQVEKPEGQTLDDRLYSSREFEAAQGNEAEQDDVAAFKQEQQIKEHEGFRGTPYDDSVGVKTVGYGRNLEANPITKSEWKAIGGKRDLTKEPLTEEEADVLFQNDLKRAKKDARAIAGYDKLSAARRGVLVDMAFNLGKSKLMKFKKFLKALREGDYALAAEEMGNSKWAKQVGSRADTLIEQMKKG